MAELPMNDEQREAFGSINRFLRDYQSGFFFRLEGYAGTGKTYMMKALSQEHALSSAAYTAPTNKATKELRKSLGLSRANCMTIYSLFGIKMAAHEDKLVLTFPRKPVDISKYKFIIIDEGSMVSEQLLDYIERMARRHRVKIIFVCDRAQLPPVGEEVSPIFKRDWPCAQLERVMRFDNQILAFTTRIRRCVTRWPKRTKLILEADNDGKEGVWRKSARGFSANIIKAANTGLFIEVDNTKIVAWRNKTVDNYNEIVREVLHGRKAFEELYLLGDRIMVAKPVKYDDRIVANIDDEGTIVDIGQAYHTDYPNIQIYRMVVQFDEGGALTLMVPHPKSESELQQQLNSLAIEAKKDFKQWYIFWKCHDAFHYIRHSYAMTVHRAQGSTLTNIFCDTTDIMANTDEYEALRCLYVGSSRPTTRLVIT